MMSYKCVILLYLIAIVFGSEDTSDSSDKAESVDSGEQSHWGYNDVASWRNEFEDCGKDDESPIDVNTNNAVIDDAVCVAKFDWGVNYDQSTFKVINNGHSLQLIAAKRDRYSSWALRRRLKQLEYKSLNTNTDSIAKFPDYFAPENSEHSQFCLDSFHFHWGSTSQYGSEHTINGEHFPLEAHFVHYACDARDLGAALDEYPQDNDPKVLAVVSVLFEVSETDNPAFDEILTHSVLKKIERPDDATTVNITEGMAVIKRLDLRNLIPNEIETAGYYAYEGSLTTPPCTDVVRWFMMNARGQISETQLEKLRTLLNADGGSIAPNYRPIQENVNGIWACTSDGELQKQYSVSISSRLFGVKIPHTTLNTTSVVIIGMGVVIFVLLVCVVCYYARVGGIYGIKNRNMLREDEIDGCVSDTEQDETESDVLIQ